MDLKEICSFRYRVVDPDISLQRVSEIMKNSQVDTVIVAKNFEMSQRPMGLITDIDLMHQYFIQREHLSKISAISIIDRPLIKVFNTTSINDAIRLMSEKGLRRVIVTDFYNNIYGILTVEGIMRFLSEQMNALNQVYDSEFNFEKMIREESEQLSFHYQMAN
ncbi:MAG: CBS domain-containing protein [Bdellovibrionales bacterium]|nr:CBS domain-containing protein [Bdellovibrionales bacterium]